MLNGERRDKLNKQFLEAVKLGDCYKVSQDGLISVGGDYVEEERGSGEVRK